MQMPLDRQPGPMTWQRWRNHILTLCGSLLVGLVVPIVFSIMLAWAFTDEIRVAHSLSSQAKPLRAEVQALKEEVTRLRSQFVEESRLTRVELGAQKGEVASAFHWIQDSIAPEAQQHADLLRRVRALEASP